MRKAEEARKEWEAKQAELEKQLKAAEEERLPRPLNEIKIPHNISKKQKKDLFLQRRMIERRNCSLAVGMSMALK